MRARLAIFVLILFPVGISLIACSSGAPVAPRAQTPKTSTVESSQVDTHTILIAAFKYQPETLRVRVGETVEWKNQDIVPHTATAGDNAFDSGNMAKNSSWKFVANEKGEHAYVCTLHPNMKGKLVVE
jgi:plastocyanin